MMPDRQGYRSSGWRGKLWAVTTTSMTKAGAEPAGAGSEPSGSGSQPAGAGSQPAGAGSQPAGSSAEPAGAGAQHVLRRSPAGEGTAARHAFLVPIKSFEAAKGRLAPDATPEARRAIAIELARRVLCSLPRGSLVVGDGTEALRDLASAHDVELLPFPDGDLNQAVAAGVAYLAGRGSRRVTIVCSDLANPADLRRFWDTGHPRYAGQIASLTGVLIVPDHRFEGTAVLSVPTQVSFRFAFGPSSLLHHVESAHEALVPRTIIFSRALSHDVDTLDDIMATEDPELVRLAGLDGP